MKNRQATKMFYTTVSSLTARPRRMLAASVLPLVSCFEYMSNGTDRRAPDPTLYDYHSTWPA